MRSVPLFTVEAADVFDDIAAAKRAPNRNRMRAARAQVLAAYQEYENSVPEVGELDHALLTGPRQEAMRHAFTVETKPMTTLRGNLLNRIAVARCPFCGISEASTLDHYLPKEQYPEFSIFPKNLAPCCAVCNTRKRDRILEDGTDVRMFLHPYYDAIPETEFLTVRTRIEANALVMSYQVVRPVGMAQRTFQQIRSHFNQLNLADRYRRMGLEHLGGLYPALRRAFGANEDGGRVSQMLLDGAEDFEEVFGPNYWLAKLYRALVANRAFCDGGVEVVRVHPVPR